MAGKERERRFAPPDADHEKDQEPAGPEPAEAAPEVEQPTSRERAGAPSGGKHTAAPDTAITVSDREQATSDAEQTLSDSDQTASDKDQTLSGRDQTAANVDQGAADLDQAASDRDQTVANREQAAADSSEAANMPQDPALQAVFRRFHQDARTARELSTGDRELASAQRAATGFERGTNATQRDEQAAIRDLTAEVRDRAAEARDRALAEYEEAFGRGGGAAAERLRAEAAADRARAAEDRARAAEDRLQAAREREQLEEELENAQLDELTGFYLRGLGTAMLQREIDRCRRSDCELTLVYIDIDRLKQVNDEQGHDAGDRLLKIVAESIRSRLRSYDPVVRMGGDEFVCILSEASLEAAGSVMKTIADALAQRQPGASISVGLASLEEGDSLETLCARADAALRETRSVSR